MIEDALPPGWIMTTLGEVIDYGKTEKVEPDEIAADSWVLELEDIEKDSSKILQRVRFSERKSKSTKNRFERGDVLFGKLRPYLNKVVIADAPGYCTTEIVPLSPNDLVEGRYLFYWLKHPTFLEYVTGASHGLNMPRLGTEAGKNAPFVLAPIAEQKRIADKLDRLLAAVDTCKARLDAIPAILKRFRQSVLAAATSGELTEEWRGNASAQLKWDLPYDSSEAPVGAPVIPPSWRWVRVADLATKVADGVHKKPNYVALGVPFITVKNLTVADSIDFSATQFISEGDHVEFIKRTKPERGDLLISKDGTLGVVRLVETDREFSIFVSVALVKPRDRRMSQYLRFAFESPAVQMQMVGVGSGLQHIHLRDLREDRIPIPPLAEQQQIASRVMTILGRVNQLEKKHSKMKKITDNLNQQILTQAFCGRLHGESTAQRSAARTVDRVCA